MEKHKPSSPLVNLLAYSFAYRQLRRFLIEYILLHLLLASRWHSLVTSSSPDPSRMRGSNSVGNFEALANPIRSIPTVFSESDLDNIGPPNYTQLTSHVSSYNKRQMFGI
ncbi:hypothetical protein MKX01_000291 [Papaver californicum]|nr:hypothetical protein MKX01_000291 [Papaver californicum]